MNFEVKDIPKLIGPLMKSAKRYTRFAFFILVAGMCGFLIFRINTFTQAEPSDEAVTEKLKTVKRPNIDATVLKRIEDLKDQNVEVDTLFKQARDNPFSE